MLPIYICEDDVKIRSVEQAYLENEILIKAYDMEIVLCTGCPEELLEVLSREQRRGIYFLDVELKGATMDGFALGQEIRKWDSRGFLIYVTAFRELAFETFHYHLEALDYICKQEPEQMFTGISRCLQVIDKRVLEEKKKRGEKEYFSVRVLDVIRHIPLEEILYFSTTGRTHRIELHARQDCMDFIGNMQELERELGAGFLRIHRAYLVQICQISSIDLKTREVIMSDGKRCAFSRRKREELLQAISIQAEK